MNQAKPTLPNKSLRNNKQKALLATYAVFIGILILSVCILAATPPISRDALTHHLFIPKLWLQQGSITPIEDHVFSFFPMNLDLLYAVPLYFGNDIIPKYIHFSFALLTAWIIYNYLSNRLSQIWGLFSALFYLSLPIIYKLSTTAYVDLGLVAFTTASLFLLLKWGENKKLTYLIWAGVMCGLAAGTKYNGLISIFLLTLFVPIIYNRYSVDKNKQRGVVSIGCMSIFVISIFASYSPWLLRNYNLTGNPIYPLYNSLFNKIKHDPDVKIDNEELEIANIAKKITSRRSSTFANRKMLYGETWWQALLLPVRFFFEGQDNDPRYFDGKLNPFLLIFMCFAFYHYRYSSEIRLEQKILFSFGLLFFFFTFFQEALRIRYIAAAIPPFIILATFGIHNLYIRLKESTYFGRINSNVIICILVVPLLSYNFFYIRGLYEKYTPYAYISGKIAKEDYITKYLPEYPVQQYANRHLKEGDKILAIYLGRRGYYFDYPVIFDLNGKRSIIGSIVVESNSADEIARKLRQKGFSHLCIRLQLFTEKANRNLTRDKIYLLNEFLLENAEQLIANKHYGLFKIKPKEK